MAGACGILPDQGLEHLPPGLTTGVGQPIEGGSHCGRQLHADADLAGQAGARRFRQAVHRPGGPPTRRAAGLRPVAQRVTGPGKAAGR